VLPALIEEFIDARTMARRQEQPLLARTITAGQLAATILIRLATECDPPLARAAQGPENLGLCCPRVGSFLLQTNPTR